MAKHVDFTSAIRFSLFVLSIALPYWLIGSNAHAQIWNQPTEIITDTPLSNFSERSGVWPSTEVPQDLYVETAESLSEFLNQVPGVQARESGSPTLSIRGSAQADRVLKLFEGLPLNLADGVGGSDLFLPQETLGSIRLIKGPASVFYGTSAMAGAVDYRLRIFERPALRLSLADDSGVIGPRSAFGVLPFHLSPSDSSSVLQATLFTERRPGRFHYDSVSGQGSGRLDHNWTDTHRATLAGDFNIGGTLLKPRVILVKSVGEQPGALNDPRVSTFSTQGSLVSLDTSHPLSDSVDLGLRFSNILLESEYDRDTASPSDSRSLRTALSVDLQTLLAESAILRTFADLNYGEFSASYLQGQKYFDNDFEVGQAIEIPLSETLVLAPAYRYRLNSGDWLKSVGLSRTLEKLRSWILYSEGFRSASLTDRYANSSFSKGNPSLQPERSRAIELGFEREPPRRFGTYGEGLSYGASVYAIRYSNLVDTASAGPGVTTKINNGQAHSIGLEANSSYSTGPWVLSLGYNLMEARNEDTDERLRLAPRHQLNARVSQQLGPILLELEDTYWSSYVDREFPSNELKELPSWNTVDFNVRTLGLMDWEMKAGVLNIFDEPRELTLSYPEPQRRFYFSALRYF